MTTMHVLTLQEYADLARTHTHNPDPWKTVMVAMSMQEAAKRGGNSSVWHNNSLVYKTKCNCAKCHPHKGTFAYKHVA